MMVTKWEVVIRAEFTFHVEAPDEAAAEALACDGASNVHVLESWRDCVEMHDEWWTIDSIEPLVNSGEALCQPAELDNHRRRLRS